MELEFIKDKVYYKIFDRTSTVSSGIYNKHKFNDAAKLAEIEKNINNIQTKYFAKALIILKQVHGNKVISTDSIEEEQAQPEADAAVTVAKNIALSIFTADCVPVLLASSDGAVIGAAHCGWKSAKDNIIANIYKTMVSKGARDIKAIIGPSIQQSSYEVDMGYYQNFVNDDADCAVFFIPSVNENHFMFDLSGYVAKKLEQANIELVTHIKDDTYSMPEKYPSYRRSTHTGEVYSQNILSTIVIR